MATEEPIEVIRLERLTGRGSIKAIASVRVAGLIIGGFKVIVPTLASHAFVSPPSRKNGDTWEPIVSILSPAVDQEITNLVLAAWRGPS